ncbi:AAA family ATPase [Klebsiella pneumoniae]|uniref:AAA family ATPase n=1 Tax=Klebsiella pneumoniae TaxID=573 RepID=UPI001600645A|nr:AAA family ATPase [Klebsiella pneumoniae]
MHDNTAGILLMGIKSIRIKNILSFDDVYIDSFEDFNLIIGRNNSGKSNLLKVFKYFYEKIRRATEHSSYSKFELHALWNNNNYI